MDLRLLSFQEVLRGPESKHNPANNVAKEGASRPVLYARLSGRQPRNKAHEDEQILTHVEERESCLSDYCINTYKLSTPSFHGARNGGTYSSMSCTRNK